MVSDSDAVAVGGLRLPAAVQVPLWDWVEVGAEPGRPAPVPVAEAAPEVELEPGDRAVSDALHVVTRSLEMMAQTETRPVLEDPPPPYRLRRLGDSDLRVFPLVLGGGAFGWTADTKATRAVLDAYFAAGGNAVDTADSFSAGRSEVLIGSWLRDRRNRDDIVLSTKISLRDDSRGLSSHAIAHAVEGSLERLATDHLDLLYFAADDTAVPLEESLTAVESLIRAGKVREVACVGYSPERLMEARVLAGQLGLPRFIGTQVGYSLLQRADFESVLSPIARAQGLAVLPHTVLGSGFLTGKHRKRRTEKGSSASSRRDEVAAHMHKRGFRILDALDAIAKPRGVAAGAVALAWVLTKPSVTAPVVTVDSAEELAELLAATSIRLTRGEVAQLDRASA
jgi:aryl-alcohol dehydrogenase-like predicted oxidoreductase